MTGIPSGDRFLARLFGKAAFYDLVLAPLAIVGVLVSGYDHYTAGQRGRGAMLFVAAVAVSALGVVKATVTFRDQRQDRRRHELEGCLHTLYAVVMGNVGRDERNRAGLRVTVYKLTADGQRFQQVVDYVGVPRPRKSQVGRTFPAQSGVIGRSLQLKAAVVADRTGDDVAALHEQLRREFSYTIEDAREVNPGVFAWMSVPLMEVADGLPVVRGVVFFDSAVRGFFTAERESRAWDACAGIGRYVFGS